MCYIVHCFVLNGKYQGYLAISPYTLNEKKGYNLIELIKREIYDFTEALLFTIIMNIRPVKISSADINSACVG